VSSKQHHYLIEEDVKSTSVNKNEVSKSKKEPA